MHSKSSLKKSIVSDEVSKQHWTTVVNVVIFFANIESVGSLAQSSLSDNREI